MKDKLVIACDVDDVLCAFTPHAHAFHKIPMSGRVHYWCERTMDERLGMGWFHNHIASVEDFWKTLPVLSPSTDIDFEVDCYISSFPIEMYDLRVNWLKEHGFPDAPLIVSMNKIKTCKDLGIDVLIDDKPATIEALKGTDTLGIHFYNEYAGFEPVGNYITSLREVSEIISLKNQFERA